MSVITGGVIIEGGPPQELSGSAAPVDGTDEVQILTITADEGTYKIGFNGWYTTALAWNANSAAVQAAMRLLPPINGANVTVTGDAPHTITFVAALGKEDQPLCTTDTAALYNSNPTAGTAVVTQSVAGVTATGRGAPAGTLYTRTTTGVRYANTGTALAPTWTAQADTLGTSYLAAVTPGTVAASKAAIVDANKDISSFRNLTAVSVIAPTVTATNVDAGASGAAGTVDVFPTTASKGKLAISVTDQAGDTTVGLVIGAMAAARTITLADPLAAADILTGKMAAVARTATVAGATTGTIADAGLLQFVAVTSAAATDQIILPTPTPGRIVILYVGANGFKLKSSAPASVAINGGTGAAAVSAIGANMMAVAICTSATSWHGFTITAATLAAIPAAA